jgi:hypothetical protein
MHLAKPQCPAGEQIFSNSAYASRGMVRHFGAINSISLPHEAVPVNQNSKMT